MDTRGPTTLRLGLTLDSPKHIELAAYRDLVGKQRNVYGRRLILLLLAAFLLLGLLNVFGQKPRESVANGDAARLTVNAPTDLRAGLFYEGRFEVAALMRLEAPVIVLERGWLDDTSINTIVPAPTEERSVDHRLELEFEPIEAGKTFVLRMQFQVNPTLGRVRSQGVEIRDGARTIASVDRTVVTYP